MNNPRITKTAKAFLEHFVLRNPRAYTTNFKKDLASQFGLTVDDLGLVCLRMADAYCLSTPYLPQHLPPQEQRVVDIANAISLGMFASSEFLRFGLVEKEKKN